MDTQVRPSRWWYLIGVALWVGSCGVTFTSAFGGMKAKVENLQRAVFPGQHQMRFTPGDYTAFYEYRSTVVGQMYATGPSLSGLNCVLTNAKGDIIKLIPSSTSTSYSLGAYAGQSMANFKITDAGSHRLACYYPSGSGKQIVVAVGPRMIGHIWAAAIVGLLGFFIGFVFIIGVSVKRRRALRELAQRKSDQEQKPAPHSV